MTDQLADEAQLSKALDQLCAIDKKLSAARARIGEPALRRWEPGYLTLIDVIVGQQVSTASANALKRKLREGLKSVAPDTILAADDAQLRACGLSRQKIAYARDLSARVADGRLDFDRLPQMEDEAVIDTLVQVKGIGRWTAEIYLLFALGRVDSWPAADLGLAVGMQHLRGLDERPNEKRLRQLAENWRPWRGAGAHFLWHYYHHLGPKGLIGATA
jgi:DNA-3-methyladenine glycosylase II